MLACSGRQAVRKTERSSRDLTHSHCSSSMPAQSLLACGLVCGAAVAPLPPIPPPRCSFAQRCWPRTRTWPSWEPSPGRQSTSCSQTSWYALLSSCIQSPHRSYITTVSDPLWYPGHWRRGHAASAAASRRRQWPVHHGDDLVRHTVCAAVLTTCMCTYCGNRIVMVRITTHAGGGCCGGVALGGLGQRALCAGKVARASS